MAKIKIAPAPTFQAQVMIPRVGSEPLAVNFTFKYLDRLGLAEFIDEQRTATQALIEGVEARSTVEQAKAEIEVQVDQLGKVVQSWGFDDQLNADSLRALATTFAGSPDAVLKAYFEAYKQARLGN